MTNFTTDMTPREFIDALLAEGKELVVRNGRLKPWPNGVWSKGLTEERRQYIRDNRHELVAEILANPRETTVVWNGKLEPDTAPQESQSGEPPTMCPDCHHTPCVGRAHWSFDLRHPNDPDVAQRRQERNLAEMLESLRRSK